MKLQTTIQMDTKQVVSETMICLMIHKDFSTGERSLLVVCEVPRHGGRSDAAEGDVSVNQISRMTSAMALLLFH